MTTSSRNLPMASVYSSPSSRPPRSTSSSSRTCLCAPTTHPGSFRCNLHRSTRKISSQSTAHSVKELKGAAKAKARSVRAVLLKIINPSSHDLRRRRNFQPKPSRFQLMNGDGRALEGVRS
ncbi:unnamed protein product [Musa acuminata subsp. burmannicoides]